MIRTARVWVVAAGLAGVVVGPAAAQEKTETRRQAVLRTSGEFLPNGAGYKVTAVDPDGPCAQMGHATDPTVRGIMDVGDIVVKVDGRAVRDRRGLFDLLNDGQRKNGTVAELSESFATLAAAKADAAKLRRWSAGMQPPDSGWKLRTITIEGADSQSARPKADAGPKTQGLFAAVYDKMERDKQVLDRLKDIVPIDRLKKGKEAGDTMKWVAKMLHDPDAAIEEKAKEGQKELQKQQGLRDYVQNVQDAYKRAKDDMLGMTGPLAEKQFGKVNGLVEKFNREAARLP